MEEERERASLKFGEGNKKKGDKRMPLPHPKKGHHVINSDVRNIYPDIIKKFVTTFGNLFFRGNKYMNLVGKNLINEGSLPVDCVLRKAPLPDEIDSEIDNSTVHVPSNETHTNWKNAKDYGEAKAALLCKATLLMLDICRSLRDRKKMPDDLDVKMADLRQFITNQFKRDVFVDEQAKGWWLREKGPAYAERLEEWTKEVEEMLRKIAGEGTIQLVIHWGQWAFRVSEGFTYDHFQ